jgi:hypothetical protein
LPLLGNQMTTTPCTDAKMSSFVAAPHWNKTFYDKFYIHSVFSIQSFHWRLQLQTRAWKNKFSLKWTTHSWCNGSAPPEGKFQPEQPMKWPGTAEPTCPHDRPVCLHSPQSSVLNKLHNSQVDGVSCLNHGVEESCAPT